MVASSAQLSNQLYVLIARTKPITCRASVPLVLSATFNVALDFQHRLLIVFVDPLCDAVQAVAREDSVAAAAAPDLMGLLDTPSAAVSDSTAISPASGLDLVCFRTVLACALRSSYVQRCDAIS